MVFPSRAGYGGGEKWCSGRLKKVCAETLCVRARRRALNSSILSYSLRRQGLTVVLPGSSIHGISQARILERVAISSSRESSRPRDLMLVSCNAASALDCGRDLATPAQRISGLPATCLGAEEP